MKRFRQLAETPTSSALESTIISHGMPYPQNFETALEVEAVVRANGAVPATVALLGGVPHVGLSKSQLHDIAQKGLKVQKHPGET